MRAAFKKFVMNHIKFCESPHTVLAWPELSPECALLSDAEISRTTREPKQWELSKALVCTQSCLCPAEVRTRPLSRICGWCGTKLNAQTTTSPYRECSSRSSKHSTSINLLNPNKRDPISLIPILWGNRVTRQWSLLSKSTKSRTRVGFESGWSRSRVYALNCTVHKSSITSITCGYIHCRKAREEEKNTAKGEISNYTEHKTEPLGGNAVRFIMMTIASFYWVITKFSPGLSPC